jgi:molybdopterin converting factor small subunit
MQITVRLLASYRRYLPRGQDATGGFPHEIAPGTRVGDVLADLPIPPDDVYTFFVNGRHADREQTLQAGDVLAIFPTAGGG